MINKLKSLKKKRLFWILFPISSIALILLSVLKIVPLSLTEVLGFITGALCVWWVVEENIWTWPVGIANNVFFIILFLQAKLFADMALQVVYIALGLLGWYWWLKGGKNKSELKVSRVSTKTAIILFLITVVSTYFMTGYLTSINDSAPFWDALTTVMSLVAQYMLTRKLLENWIVWISADIIYIALYASKNLYLTSVLYFVFLLMCVEGYRQWKKSRKLAIEEAVVLPR